MGNLVAYPYEKMLTRSPEKDDYFPELVDSIPEKVDVLIWLSQILALILYTITTNPLKMQYMTNTSIMRVGGVSLKAISHILSALTLFAGLLLITSCEKEITPPAYQSQLQRYHTESLALQQVTADSVHRFQLKVSDFAVAYPEVTSEQLYHQIRQNIYDAYLVIGIEPGAWGEDKEIEFTFGNQ